MISSFTNGHFGFVYKRIHRVINKQSSARWTVTAVPTDPCSLNVTLFPLTIVTLTVDQTTYRVRYTMYQQPEGGQSVGSFLTRRCTWSRSSANRYGTTSLYIAPNYILEHQDNPKNALPHADPHAGPIIESPPIHQKEIRLKKTREQVPPKYRRHHRATSKMPPKYFHWRP